MLSCTLTELGSPHFNRQSCASQTHHDSALRRIFLPTITSRLANNDSSTGKATVSRAGYLPGWLPSLAVFLDQVARRQAQRCRWHNAEIPVSAGRPPSNSWREGPPLQSGVNPGVSRGASPASSWGGWETACASSAPSAPPPSRSQSPV